jgi:hypothetical protein
MSCCRVLNTENDLLEQAKQPIFVALQVP